MQYNILTTKYVLIFFVGLTSGLAAWTKNEGWLFLISIIAARLIVPLMAEGRRGIVRQMAWFAVGAIPVITVALYFKIELAPSNDLISISQLPVIKRQLFDFSRYYIISKSFLGEVFIFHRWGYIAPLLIIYIIYLFFTGFSIPGDKRVGIVTAVLTIGFILIGYFFIYVITPHDLNLHLSTSLNRLFMQLWASVIFVYFLAVPVLEEHR